VTLMALMISLVALSIDAMLPALGEIGRDLGVTKDNDRQWIIGALFAGLAIGQMLYGPVSDSVGRKPPIYAGFLLFIAGCLVSAFATNFNIMLVGRFLQGLGAAGPRNVAIALVRDQYEGNTMAKVISLVMAVFIIVPALAPAVGQGILLIAHWRAIFGMLFALAVISLVWFAWRQPETLAIENRVPFSVARIMTAIVEVCTHRTALGYTIAAGLIFGAFVGFLSSVQQIFQEQYALGAKFPLYFAALALSIGGASLANSRLVMRYGMQQLSLWAVLTASVLSTGFLLFVLIVQGSPPLIVLMTYLVTLFFCIGILFGNFNALAMGPMGHIAGVASAVIGLITTALSVLLGASIGAMYDGTVVPMVVGFTAFGAFALLAVYITQRSERCGQSGNS